jgi:hypothetical protein
MSARAGIGDLHERAAVHGRHAALESIAGSSAPGMNGFSRTQGQPSPAPLNVLELLRAALKRRLRPWSMTSALTVKDVARAIASSEDTLLNWINGRSAPAFEKAGDLIAFFWSLGDRAFLSEIYGLPPLGVVAELKRPLIEARAMLDQALGQEVA